MRVIRWLKKRKPAGYHWLTTACLIIAVYMILDGLTFMLNPYSGRISTFACMTNPQTGTLCTVTIYGLREIYRKSFTSDEFYRAVVIMNYPGDSFDTTYGLTIQTMDENINYIYPIQPPDRLEQKARQLNDLFVDGEPVPDTFKVHIGLDSSLYRRLLLILFVFALAWYVSRADISRYWFDQPKWLHRGSFWTFMWCWVGVDIIARFGFLISKTFIVFIDYFRYSNTMADFVSGCRGIFAREPELFQFPWGYLLCLYPLVSILLMQALLQRQLLARVNIKLSAWWVAAPLLAIPMLPVFTPHLICDDCYTIKYLLSGHFYNSYAPINTSLVFYFLLLGLIQWFVIRKKLTHSFIWVTKPLINTMLVMLAYLVIEYNLPETGNLRALIPLTMILGKLIPALTMSWLVNQKAAVPDPGD